jgi:glycosyltransferase involved in cell wall biosynthesis
VRKSFGIKPDDIVMTYAGRIANEKNLEMLVNAWQQLEEFENVHLLFIGDGPLRTKLEAMNTKRTIFAGYRYGEELASIYASSDIFVFPSLSETFGNVVLEAMASGLPVVAYKVQGPKDIVQDKVNGLLVNDVSSEALARAMRKMLVNNELRWQMGSQARNYAEGQTWDQIMGKMRAEYISILSANLPQELGVPQADKSAA